MNPVCFYPLNLFFDRACADLSLIPIGPSNSSIFFYILLFSLTCLLESPFYLFFSRQNNLTLKKRLLQIFILNLATHPLVHFGISGLGANLSWSIFTYICVAEGFAFSVEIFLLKFIYKYSLKHATMAATTANLCSWSVGVWLLVHQIL